MAVLVNTAALSDKADECTQGRSCGLACIARDKECLKHMSPRSAEVLRRMAKIIAATEEQAQASAEEIVRQRGKGDVAKEKKKILDNLKKQQEGFFKMKKYLEDIDEQRPKLKAAMEKACAGGGAGSDACKKATEALRTLDTRRTDAREALNALADGAAEMKRDPQGKQDVTQEEIDGLRKYKDSNIRLADAMHSASAEFDENIKNGMRPREAQKILDDKIRAAYEKEGITYPNDLLLPDDFTNAAYDMLPVGLKEYMNYAGSPGGKASVAGINKDKDGRVVSQEKSIQKGKNVNRGKAALEIYMRTGGIDQNTGEKLNPATMQLEHFSPLSKYTHADTLGAVGFISEATNNWKNNMPMGEWYSKAVDNVKTVADKVASSAKKKGAKAEAIAHANNAKGKNSDQYQSTIQPALADDKKTVSRYQKYQKERYGKDDEHVKDASGYIAANNLSDRDRIVLTAAEQGSTGSAYKYYQNSDIKKSDGSSMPSVLANKEQEGGGRSQVAKLNTKGQRIWTSLYQNANDGLRKKLVNAHERTVKRANEKEQRFKPTSDRFDTPLKEELAKEGYKDWDWMPNGIKPKGW